MARDEAGELIVHVDVRMLGLTECQPEDALDAVLLQPGEQVVDRLHPVVRELVVADHHHDGRAEIVVQVADVLEHARGDPVPDVTALVLDPPAGGRLQVQVDPLCEDVLHRLPVEASATESPKSVTCARPFCDVAV
jgi:hypothetical protein